MAFDEGLAERIRNLVPKTIELDEKKMFGGLAFLYNGHMFCGLTQSDLMIRVGAEHYQAALSEPHAREMDFTGKPLKGFVYIDAEGISEDGDLLKWLNRGLAYVATLPPKSAANNKKSKRS